MVDVITLTCKALLKDTLEAEEREKSREGEVGVSPTKSPRPREAP